jgi:hypothetical protein
LLGRRWGRGFRGSRGVRGRTGSGPLWGGHLCRRGRPRTTAFKSPWGGEQSTESIDLISDQGAFTALCKFVKKAAPAGGIQTFARGIVAYSIAVAPYECSVIEEGVTARSPGDIEESHD